uniref:Uncharacterized protein n=1 Tax=Arundo donax TaxID=35708 RepID=A0A0A9GLH9_ARUDO
MLAAACGSHEPHQSRMECDCDTRTARPTAASNSAQWPALRCSAPQLSATASSPLHE